MSDLRSTSQARKIEAVPSVGHFVHLIRYRKWLVVSVFLAITLTTVSVAYLLPDVYTSETVILVDPQKVPDSYVKATVTGDVRDRLSTLSQQILSATRLQTIINALNLYPKERKTMAREDVILKMRNDIQVQVVSDFGGSQDLQAFRISYSGEDPRLVATVTNELASLFIDENLKSREEQATGTTEFLQNQVEEARKTLEEQEAKLRDFKLKHIGEMPDQQNADLQIYGQVQSQLQLEDEALARAEQQKSYLESLLASQSAPVADMDGGGGGESPDDGGAGSKLAAMKAQLSQMLAHYSPEYPDVKKLKRQIAEEEAKLAPANSANPAVPQKPHPVAYSNPVIEAQLTNIENEIARHKAEKARLSRQVGGYQAKLEAIPVNEQEVAGLVRDYEMSKAHYSQLLDKQLSAQTATQLEIRQKGERFSVLDPAQPAERPSRPHRELIIGAGAVVGLVLGLLSALASEIAGASITSAEQVSGATGIAVLEVIPSIQTDPDRKAWKRRLIMGVATAVVFCAGCGVVVVHHMHKVA